MMHPEEPDASAAAASHVSVRPLGPGAAAAVCALGRSLGLHCARIDLDGCRGKDDALQRIATALEFPAWFGGNWDALFDCLNDLGWLAARGYVLVFENAQELREAAPGDFATLLDLLRDTADAWSGRGVAFRAILDAD